jgi:two-component system, NtrC family, sensor kinase
MAMRRRSRASSKLANARSHKAKTLKAARRSSSSVAARETEVARLARERDKALEREKATAEILGIISSSPGELEPVFQAMLEKATRICEAKFGLLYRIKNGAARIISRLGMPPAFEAYLRRGPHRPPLNRLNPLTPIGRVVQTPQQSILPIIVKIKPTLTATQLQLQGLNSAAYGHCSLYR